MSRWSDLSDADLDQRLADELQSMADKPRLGPEWARLEFLPAVRSQLGRPTAQASSRLAPLYGIAGAIGALAALAVLMFVVFTRPPSTAGPAGTPPSSTVRSGDFTLTITADKAVYAPGEPMEVQAELAYLGETEVVALSGVEHLIAGFGARQLDGPLVMEADWPVPGACHELRTGEPITRAYAKSAGWSSDDPNAGFYEEWVTDPQLWLPAGRWQINAIAEFSVGDCGTAGERVGLEATIEVLVEEATASPSPSRTPPSTWASINTHDFAARVRAGELRGQTVPVVGEIFGRFARLIDPLPRCAVGELCDIGQLGGVEPPLAVHARHTPTVEGPDAVEATAPASSWEWWHRPQLRDGVHVFLLRVLDDGKVEYLGYQDDEHPWALSSLATAVQPENAPLDEVVLVSGWLIGGPTSSCPALPEGSDIDDLPGRRCSPHAWIAPDPDTEVDSPAAVQVQSGAYAEFAGTNPAAAAPEPVPGLWALARRLEGSGCPDGNVPCWRWNLIAKVIYAEDGPAMPAATPAPGLPTATPPTRPSPSIPAQPTPIAGPVTSHHCILGDYYDPVTADWVLDATGIVESCQAGAEVAAGEPIRVSNPSADLTRLLIEWSVAETCPAAPVYAEFRAGATDGRYLLIIHRSIRVDEVECAGGPGTESLTLELSEPIVASEVDVSMPSDEATADTSAGTFRLRLSAAEAVFHDEPPLGADTPVDVRASFWYEGGAPTTVISGGVALGAYALDHPIVLSAEQLDGPGEFFGGLGESCNRYELGEGEPWTAAFGAGHEGGTLPYGVWKISAAVHLDLGTECGASEAAALEASIVVRVLPVLYALPGTDEIALRTSPPNTTGICRMAQGGGFLAPHPETGLGVGDQSGENVRPVIWPHAFTAHRDGEAVVLYWPDGRILAREGDYITFGGGIGNEGMFAACGSFEVTPQP